MVPMLKGIVHFKHPIMIFFIGVIIQYHETLHSAMLASDPLRLAIEHAH
jgi:hypothetical protein